MRGRGDESRSRCQLITKWERLWAMQSGKDPVTDPAARSLLGRCDQAIQQHCGFSLPQCEEAKAALND